MLKLTCFLEEMGNHWRILKHNLENKLYGSSKCKIETRKKAWLKKLKTLIGHYQRMRKGDIWEMFMMCKARYISFWVTREMCVGVWQCLGVPPFFLFLITMCQYGFEHLFLLVIFKLKRNQTNVFSWIFTSIKIVKKVLKYSEFHRTL